MQKIETVAGIRSLAAQLKPAGRTVALVPTSGALHAGHVALIAAAKARADAVIVSIFVNPLEFGPSDNFAAYPRTPEADLELCRELGVDAVFMPPTEEIFPRGYSTYVSEDAVGRPLCGAARPAHFRGVASGCVKLLHIVRPDILVLGQLDAQQVAVVRKVLTDLCIDVDLVVCPIVRESDGLAVMVRSRQLTNGQRTEALAIPAALRRGTEMVTQGVRSPDRVAAEATHLLRELRRIRVIYVAVVDSISMEPVREIVSGRTVLSIAAWVDEVRVIDNTIL